MVQDTRDVGKSLVVRNDKYQPFIDRLHNFLKSAWSCQSLHFGEGSSDAFFAVTSLLELSPKFKEIGLVRWLSTFYPSKTIGQRVWDVLGDV